MKSTRRVINILRELNPDVVAFLEVSSFSSELRILANQLGFQNCVTSPAGTFISWISVSMCL